MKLVLPSRGPLDSAATPVTVTLPTSDNNETFETLLNVQMTSDRYGTGTTVTPIVQTAPIKVIGTSETTTKGVRRILIKTELPYGALKEGPDGTYIKDVVRSGGAISAHMVITAPKELVEDITATGEVQSAALCQLLLVKTLMQTLASNGDSFFSTGDGGECVTPALSKWVAQHSNYRLVSDDGVLVGYLTNELSFLQGTAVGRGLLGLKPFGTDIQNINVVS